MDCLYMAFSIHFHHQGIFYSQQEEEHTIEPHLFLSLRSEVDVDGEIITQLIESRHRFNDCNPSFLNSVIMEKEPIPLAYLMDSDAVDTRESISRDIFYLVKGCVGIAGLKWLQVEVVYRVYEDREVNNEELVLRERRMAFTQKIVDCSALSAEVCAVCLEEMGGGGRPVVCTPCGHRFHTVCVRRWFEKSGFCPLCRFQVGP